GEIPRAGSFIFRQAAESAGGILLELLDGRLAEIEPALAKGCSIGGFGLTCRRPPVTVNGRIEEAKAGQCRLLALDQRNLLLTGCINLGLASCALLLLGGTLLLHFIILLALHLLAPHVMLDSTAHQIDDAINILCRRPRWMAECGKCRQGHNQ